MTDRNRTPRTLMIPDHVWQAYEQMAADMGAERDGLVSQALFAFARMNGYLIPSDLQRLGLSSPPAPAAAAASAAPAPAPITTATPAPAAKPPEPIVPAAPPPRAAPLPRPPSRPSMAAAKSGPATIMMDESPNPRRSANPERMAELERQLAPQASGVEVDDALLGDDGVHATSMELPNLRDLGDAPMRGTPMSVPHSANTGARNVEVAGGGQQVLVISADGRELDRVVKERFLIGRGKHCDLIINSGKVSREHAAITREGSDYFIEDLGSSNGTWFDKRRITKRQIQEGDEYFICAEKLACSFTA